MCAVNNLFGWFTRCARILVGVCNSIDYEAVNLVNPTFTIIFHRAVYT